MALNPTPEEDRQFTEGQPVTIQGEPWIITDITSFGRTEHTYTAVNVGEGYKNMFVESQIKECQHTDTRVIDGIESCEYCRKFL